MIQRSLRVRLLIAAIVSISGALIIAAFGFVAIFERHVERRIGSELETHINQMIAGIRMTVDDRIAFTRDLADPRFSQPLSGLYWQIQDEARPTLLRSRSLWDDAIDLPEDELSVGNIHEHLLPGPGGQLLLVRERQIIYQSNTEDRRVRIAVAMDRQSLISARDAFAADMLPYLMVMALVLMLAAWLQVKVGLAPLDMIRRGISAIRSGEKIRLSTDYPKEVMPLVEEMNGLLEGQEEAIERAKDWTADLAHGLKTPLMALTTDAQRLREQGNGEIAEDLDQLAETMRQRVDRELIRARVRSGIRSRSTRVDLRQVIDDVIRTLKRTPPGADIRWIIHAPDEVSIQIPSDSLTELLGNLLENATKWADKKITITVSKNGATSIIRIEDDGQGVPDDQLTSLGLRGLRLDEQRPGSGLGLAIARDILEAYQGELSFDHALLGGLAVVIRIPDA